MIRALQYLRIGMMLVFGSAMGQSVTVDEPDVCYTCHDDIQGETTRKNQHTAFEAGKCSDCHNPHASRHASLLYGEVGDLCLTCHDDLKHLDSLPSQHQPVTNGECLACHDPHASDFRNQLVKSTGALCEGCHSGVAEWLKQSRPHSPVAGRDCLKCHAAHGSENQGILVQAMPRLCFECHQQDPQLAAVHKGFNLSSADCSTCHDPHASSHKGLLMANQHAPFEAGDCTTCHSKDAQTQGSFAIAGSLETLCFNCHEDLELSQQAEFRAHLGGDQSCNKCHNPHASNNGALLSSSQQTLCTKCHFTDVPAKVKAKYLTHPDQDCSICHEPHGADNERYLLDPDPMKLCKTCHADVHRNSHPMGPDFVDKRTNGPLDCLSCHKMHGASQPFYLAFNPDMDLCIQCHKR